MIDRVDLIFKELIIDMWVVGFYIWLFLGVVCVVWGFNFCSYYYNVFKFLGVFCDF